MEGEDTSLWLSMEEDEVARAWHRSDEVGKVVAAGEGSGVNMFEWWHKQGEEGEATGDVCSGGYCHMANTDVADDL